jgi:hypothetical protein
VTTTYGLVARLAVAALALPVVFLVGCHRGEGTAGGPGATDPAAKPPLFGQADDTFNLTVSSVSLQQGSATPGTIGIKRGTNFVQDVTLAFDGLPKGVALDPSGPAIKSGDTEAKFTLTASDDAALGDFTVKVVGHPTKGGDATNQFKLTVAKRDSFALSMPVFTTGLKQGETRSVSVGISRDKRFDQDVTLAFDGLPKGVSVEPAGAVIRNGASEVKFVLKAADDAAPGDFTAKATGHPTKGADVTHDFKFTVAKK